MTLIKSKLPNTGTTIFTIMSALANEHNALNLSQGFPDFPTDPVLVELVNRFMKDGYNQYSPLGGVPSLRQVLSDIIFEEHGHRYDPETEVTITHGATQAIASALTAAIREGDEVIIFTPAYDCYAPMVELNGGVPIYIQLPHPDYRIDWASVKNRINHRTRMIIINTPHNPTSMVWTEEDLRTLEEITADSNILILADEVYEEIVFSPKKHHSVAGSKILRERSFKIGSLGKVLHVTGWKIGYCMAPEEFMKEFRKVHQFHVFSANTPIQMAMAEYLKDPASRNIAGMLEQKRNLFREVISDSGFEILPSEGSYFQLLGYSKISNLPDTEFARKLTIENKVASIPISVFYHIPTDKKVLRFCFAKNDQTLVEAGKRLSQIS